MAHAELSAVSEMQWATGALIGYERQAHDAHAVSEQDGEKKSRPSRAKHLNFDLTQYQREVIAANSIKVGDYLTKLFRRGLDAEIRMSIRAGNVPLSRVSGYRSLKLAVSHLHAGFNRNTLKTYFMDSMGWTRTAATSEVSVIWIALQVSGIAIEANGRLVFDPNLIVNN